MKKQLLTLTLAAAALTQGFAAMPSVTSFPPVNMPEGGASTRSGMMRAPLNQDAAKGMKVFGSTFADYNMVRNFANYYQNQYSLEKLNTVFNSNDRFSETPSLYMIFAGAYCPDDGYYYAYRVQYYTIGIAYSDAWMRVNPTDGSWEIVSELEDKAHEDTYLYDLAYSPFDGEMFGLVQNADGQVKSRVGKINMENSEVTDMIQLDDYYYAIAFDYDGNMYGVRWKYGSDNTVNGTMLDVFDSNFKVAKSTEIKVNGASYPTYYQHGLDFDYTTGDLIWSATNMEGYQHMVHLNPDTAEGQEWGAVGYSESMIGLYVPYTTASHREAPAVVTDKAFTIDPQGADKVTLTWTNPSTTWNRKPLTDLQKVVIYRDEHKGTPVGEVAAAGQEGKAASFTDTGTTKGVHKYYIIAVNAKGEGVESSIEAYVGHDVPGPVQDITARAIDGGKSAEISWSAPVTGDSNGWFDPNLTYDIVRLPDNVQVATGLTATTYTDSDIPEAKYYSYQITAISADGKGTPAVSNGVLAGASLAIPFATNFQNDVEANRFSSFDNFGTPNLFEYDFNGNDPSGKCMKFLYDKASDATLASPKMNVTKGKNYRVEWTFTLNRFGQSFEDTYHHLRVVGGTEPTYEAMSDLLQDYPQFHSTYNHQEFTLTTYFTAPVDGDYCVGLNVKVEDQSRKEDWIYVTGFSISERFADDLAVTGFDCPVIVSAVDDNYFDVQVHNAGTTAQKDYNVQVGISRLDGTFVPFATTSDVPELAADAKATVRVAGKPAEYGVQDIMARVVMDNDANKLNDDSELCETLVNGALPYNYTVTIPGTEWFDTQMPIYTWYSNTLCQTIYTPALLGLPEGENQIGGLAWEYRSNEDMPNVKLRVELTTFDRDYYGANRPVYVTEGLTKVFDGTVNLEEGSNHWMYITFPDNTFAYDGTKNLVVTTYTEAPSSTTFPLQFVLFNSPSALLDTDSNTHTLVSRNDGDIDIATAKKFSYQEYPKLHVALKSENSGINGIVGQGEFGLSVRGNSVLFSGDVRSAAVYDMNGRLMRTAALNGAASMDLNLAPGVYVIMARDAAGNVKTLKFMAH